MDEKRLNGIIESMGGWKRGSPLLNQEFSFGFGFDVKIEPSLTAMDRVRAEQAAAHEAGQVWQDYPLVEADLDIVTRKVYVASPNTSIQLPGGLTARAALRCDEIDRRPYLELLTRAREAFAQKAQQDRGHLGLVE